MSAQKQLLIHLLSAIVYAMLVMWVIGDYDTTVADRMLIALLFCCSQAVTHLAITDLK